MAYMFNFIFKGKGNENHSMIIEINCNRLEVEFQGPLCTVCNECIIMGFGDIYMVPYIPGILEELLVHCTATIWEWKWCFSAMGTGTEKKTETNYILQFNYHIFGLSSIKVFCAMQLT